LIDVALVTCARLPEPDFDAEPLVGELSRTGLAAEIRAWDDPRASWSDTRVAILRSCWNYPRHAERFLAWADATSRVTSLWNPIAVVRWNLHKGYLLDLERAGVPIAPTVLVRRESSETLDAVVARRGWDRVVVKPAVSAASWRTERFDRDAIADGERHLRALTQDGDVLVQQYLPSVEDYGERAVIWIDGELTHAVRKSPRFSGDEESVSQAVAIADDERDVAAGAVAAVGHELLYARVDLARRCDGSPAVMELELIEPSLFFRQGPVACVRLVAALHRLAGQARVGP
jgi:glutathione synthase/RimK-type ligase-like ATP-grasp enzyme